MSWTVTEHLSYLQKLLVPGVIGTYNSFEVTEVFGFHPDRPGQVTNFMSLLVAEPSAPPKDPGSRPVLLNGKKPIELRGTPWKFGIARYRVSTQRVLQALNDLDTVGEWKLGGSALRVGLLTPLPPQLVPADTWERHPWNGVLKNNFWDGSHVLELVDGQKTEVQFLLAEPKLLKELAEKVTQFAKFAIDGLSDRLGNVLIQLPITVLTASVSGSQNGDFVVQPIWRKGATARPLRVSCEKYEDTTVEGYGSEDAINSQVVFPLHLPGGGARYVLWDDQHRLVLGASAQTAFVTSIGLNVQALRESTETRDFSILSANGTSESVAIPLIEVRAPNIIGTPTSNPREPWRENRIFRDSLKSLRERKEFIQYGGNSGAGAHDALTDIHALLRMHGETGAWLWDPYLDARDVITTLFYCPHKGSDLRALTAAMEPPIAKGKEGARHENSICQRVESWIRSRPCAGWIGLKSESVPLPKLSWKDKQLETFEKSKGNCKDLRLEFRVREGSAGWPFHDRFLIFPSSSGPAKAWSLGTSVNSFGQKHHILQKVADGELIRQAFLDLWDELSGRDYLVWSTP
ncbi:VPA1262 family N-terminal domain-containing protein [Variovorax gossypii]